MNQNINWRDKALKGKRKSWYRNEKFTDEIHKQTSRQKEESANLKIE